MQINSNVLSFGYDGSAPTTVTYGGNTYYYVTNLQGDIVSILDGNRTEVVKYTYDAWGNILSTTGTLADTLGEVNPLRYRGYVYDSECDLYYLQSRYYDPSIGRYLNHDVLFDYNVGIRGYNLFAYCGNSPVFRLDPYGRASIGADEDADITNDVVSEKEGGGTGVNYGNPNPAPFYGGSGASGNSPGASNGGNTSNATSSTSNSGYTTPSGGGGISGSQQVNGITVTFGHGGRHLEGTGYTTADIEPAIASNVVAANPDVNSFYKGSVSVGGIIFEYSSYRRSNFLINVGTYYEKTTFFTK